MTLRMFIALSLLAAILVNGCGYLSGVLPPPKDPAEGITGIRLPFGFRIEIWANGVDNARSMTLGPGGTVFVGTRDAGKVYAIPSDSREVITIATGLHSPNGVAMKDGALYVAEIGRVIRFGDIERSLRNPPPFTVINDSFPQDEAHGWKFISFGPDGRLYVPVGMPCNICVREDARFGSIMRMNPDGSGLEIFARGIRNTVGFDWHPVNHDLWFTENGRDWLGDDRPPDELNRADKPGMNFGFPYCYGRNTPDPEFTDVDCSPFTPAALELGPHVAALGMRFYTGRMFPERYRGGIFVAEHGSWNRTVPIGYRLVFVALRDTVPVSHELFAEGWLEGSVAWGRPVDVLVMPDGSLLVSDDKAGVIYRITYSS